MIVYFHSQESPMPSAASNDFVALMNEVSMRTRYIDDMNQVLDESASLKFLYYHRTTLNE